MPFKSEKQRKWMWANDPEMAKKWEKEEKKMKETKVRALIRKMVREIMNEDFAGAHPSHKREKFDKMRQKQSEVLGYTLTGSPDVKVEIDDATIKEEKLNEGSDTFVNILTKFGFTKGARSWGGHHFFVHKGKKLYATYHPAGRSLVIEPKRGGKPVFDSDRSNFSIRALLQYLQSPSNKFVSTEGKINEAKEPLWNKNNVKDVIKQIQKGIKVPYADGLGLGALSRRDEHPTIMGKISVDDKKDWRNGYIENSRWALVRIEANGIIDTVRMNGYGDFKTRKKVPILRKSKNKSIKQIIDRLGKYFTVVRLKHPDNK